MVVVDTSVWVDHLHRPDTALTRVLHGWSVVQHPMVIGELALGSIKNRHVVLESLAGLPTIPVASHDEVMTFVESNALHGIGLSLVDAHLPAAAVLTPGTTLWTGDRRLLSAAEKLHVSYESV